MNFKEFFEWIATPLGQLLYIRQVQYWKIEHEEVTRHEARIKSERERETSDNIKNPPEPKPGFKQIYHKDPLPDLADVYGIGMASA